MLEGPVWEENAADLRQGSGHARYRLRNSWHKVEPVAIGASATNGANFLTFYELFCQSAGN